jgi:hypothetical protein
LLLPSSDGLLTLLKRELYRNVVGVIAFTANHSRQEETKNTKTRFVEWENYVLKLIFINIMTPATKAKTGCRGLRRFKLKS